MQLSVKTSLPIVLIAALALAGCSAREDTSAAATTAGKRKSAAAPTGESALAGLPTASPVATGTRAPDNSDASRRALTLDGLGDLVVGKPAPADSSFGEHGAQIGEDCRLVSSPAFPGVYAITRGKGGPVRRITVSEGSDVRLAEGVGAGASEREVLAAFPGFRASAHKYVGAPGKYLTQPGSAPRLRFEIDETGRVAHIHVGLMPELGYVEGCA